MASRPVFVPLRVGSALVEVQPVEFTWFPGLSRAQKQRSVDSLHDAARRTLGLRAVLEVSSKSREPLGVALSAFNLTFTPSGLRRSLVLECAFQGSKVFENGGPFIDLFEASPRDAKRDKRLVCSGALTCFRFLGASWPLTPTTAFYDWLYLTAVAAEPALVGRLSRYSGFTDIEFNPERSLNCQARAAALCVALSARGHLTDALASQQAFLALVGANNSSPGQQDSPAQGVLKL